MKHDDPAQKPGRQGSRPSIADLARDARRHLASALALLHPDALARPRVELALERVDELLLRLDDGGRP